MTRPRGRPPMPRAMSRAIEPVGMTFMATSGLSPSRMTEPLPNCLSIWARAMSSALSRSSVAMVHTFGSRGSGSEPTLGRGTDSFGAGGGPVESRPACGRNCRTNTCSIARATRHLVPPRLSAPWEEPRTPRRWPARPCAPTARPRSRRPHFAHRARRRHGPGPRSGRAWARTDGRDGTRTPAGARLDANPVTGRCAPTGLDDLFQGVSCADDVPAGTSSSRELGRVSAERLPAGFGVACWGGGRGCPSSALRTQRRTSEVLVDADLDTLATALYVRADDLLKDCPERAPERPAVGFAPKITDAELITLAVMQALCGRPSEVRWLRYAHAGLRHLFPYLPKQPGYNKRLRALTDTICCLISMLARDTSLFTDDHRIVDSTR